jgi:hypothetical protein
METEKINQTVCFCKLRKSGKDFFQIARLDEFVLILLGDAFQFHRNHIMKN